MKAIRNEYKDQGVENFYRKNGAHYSNPHFPQIKKLLEQNQKRIDYSSVLDFCCGGGEVAMVLAELGFDKSSACDPFTQKAYLKNTKKKALSYSFDDVIRGKMEGEYSAVICSFAMHLCPKEQLYPLTHRLFETTNQIIIITPHKRPALEKLDGVDLEFNDFVLTPKGKKVWLKSYVVG